MPWLIASIVLVGVATPVAIYRMNEARRRAAVASAETKFLSHAREALSGLTDDNLVSVGPSAVGKGGMILKYEDGSWVAITYGESKAELAWFCAVAYDSLGRFYESRNGFGDSITAFRQAMSGGSSQPPVMILQSDITEEIEAGYADGVLAPLMSCNSALGLEEALFAIGFTKARASNPTNAKD
jgi:type II secretory pathway pseudopilin PulG